MEAFGLLVAPDLEPRFNIAPSQPVPVVRADEHGTRHLDQLRWGLIPSWAKDPKIGHRLINARAETVAEKPSFRAAFKRRRCLVAASGFFEWQATPAGKVPMYISHPSGWPYAFAGLWEHWQGDEGEPIESCVIITVPANNRLRSVHDRMPAILTDDAQTHWLSASTAPRDAHSLLLPAPDSATNFWPVSSQVNNPAHQGAELLAPADPV
jgi:putative SOS response-associated peptidase YedK